MNVGADVFLELGLVHGSAEIKGLDHLGYRQLNPVIALFVLALLSQQLSLDQVGLDIGVVQVDGYLNILQPLVQPPKVLVAFGPVTVESTLVTIDLNSFVISKNCSLKVPSLVKLVALLTKVETLVLLLRLV